VTATSSERYVVVSTDGHCGADVWGYKPYLVRRYHDEFDAWAATYHDAWGTSGDADSSDNGRLGFESFGSALNWDSDKRLQYASSQGIAAEVLFPNTSPPFYPSGAISAPGPRDSKEYEYRLAGLRAHNRWLADFCAATPNRRIGLAQLFLDDIEAAVDEVVWAKEHGLGGVLLPGDHVLQMNNLYYPWLDRLWAVCEDVGLPIHRHANLPCESADDGGVAAPWVGSIELVFYEKRAIAHLICSGVFERFPKLKFVATELTVGAPVASYLAKLDAQCDPRSVAALPFIKDAVDRLTRRPSEYFATNCFLGGPLDLPSAYASGTPNLMFGADIPHSEGTAPHTLETMRAWLSDLPPTELRAILGTRAVEVYGLNPAELQRIADQVGPRVEDLSTLPGDQSLRSAEKTECHSPS
jgi:predicted TIM-barrel fold metal-dependent hydrolase